MPVDSCQGGLGEGGQEVGKGCHLNRKLYYPSSPLAYQPAQTTASAFAADVTYGGANYLASGRGFAYHPSSFVLLYASYGRTHLHLGEKDRGRGGSDRVGLFPPF